MSLCCKVLLPHYFCLLNSIQYLQLGWCQNHSDCGVPIFFFLGGEWHARNFLRGLGVVGVQTFDFLSESRMLFRYWPKGPNFFFQPVNS